MRTKHFTMMAAAMMLTACNEKKEETPAPANDAISIQEESLDSNDSSTELFACPMHPEVTGKKDDICPKCKMKLTEPVLLENADHHDGQQH